MSNYIPNFIRRVIGYLLEETELTPYRPILREAFQQKMARIYQDGCYINLHGLSGEQQLQERQHESRLKLWVARIFFSWRKCLDPCLGYLLMWYVLVFWSIMYFFIEMGVMIVYGQGVWRVEKSSGAMLGLNVFFLLVLYGDIVVQFAAGYVCNGVLVVERERVVARYLRYGLAGDLVVAVVESVAVGSDGYAINYFKVVVVFKFFRMFQMDEYYLRAFDLNRGVKTVYVIGKQAITIFVLAHTIGIIFYWIDYTLVMGSFCEDDRQFCWLLSSAYSPIIELDWSLRYFYSLYWGVNTITTISYDDITPANPYETIYMIGIMFIAFASYAYIVNNIVSIILWARRDSNEAKHQNILIDTYMQGLGIEDELQEKVRAYLVFLRSEQFGRDVELEKQMMAKLPEQLRFQLLRGLYYKVNDDIKLMLNLSDEVTELLPHIQESLFIQNEEIIVQGEEMNRLLYLNRGEVRIECEYYQRRYFVAKVESEDNFLGQVYFFRQQKMPVTILAEKTSIVYYVSREIFEQKCRESPVFKESLRSLQYCVKISKEYHKINQFCYYCAQNHSWNECPTTFPDFGLVRLMSSMQSKQNSEKRKKRRAKHNTLYHINSLRQLHIFKRISEDQFYGNIQKRLRSIKNSRYLSSLIFEVDVAYDWSIYFPEQNLSKIRMNWERKQVQKRLTKAAIFRKSLEVDL